MRKLRVYGWQGTRSEAPGHHHATREICAAPSMAAAARAAGYERPGQLFNICETGNALEVAEAMKQPGVVLWSGLDERPKTWRVA